MNFTKVPFRRVTQDEMFQQKLPQLTEIINGLYMNLNLTVDSQTKFFKELDYRVILFEFQ